MFHLILKTSVLDMFHFALLLLIVGNIWSRSPDAPLWGTGVKYEFRTEDQSNRGSGQGEFMFNFDMTSNVYGWKVSYVDDNHPASYKVFNRAMKEGRMVYVDVNDNGTTIGCMKMSEKPIADTPCKQGEYVGAVYLDDHIRPEVVYQFNNCQFGGYLMDYFPSTAVNFTIYYDIYQENVKRICYEDCKYKLTVENARLLLPEEINGEMSVPAFCPDL